MGKFSGGLPENSGGNDWFKLVEGKNRVRILTDGAILAEHFKIGVCVGKDKGCKGCDVGDKATYKKLFWIIDRVAGELKLVKLGSVILNQLDALSEDEEYSFDGFPMPYDVNISAKGAGTKEVEYTVVPSPKRSEITEEELTALSKQKTPEDIVGAMKDKMLGIKHVSEPQTSAGLETIEYPIEDINPEDIPF